VSHRPNPLILNFHVIIKEVAIDKLKPGNANGVDYGEDGRWDTDHEAG
jgi:hypothetical protein